MRLDCPLSCSQFSAGLLVQETSSDQSEDIAFAGREAAVAFFQFDTLDVLGALRAREIGAACYRAQQRFIVDRLFEKIHGTFPHRMHSDRQITIGGDENYRCE